MCSLTWPPAVLSDMAWWHRQLRVGDSLPCNGGSMGGGDSGPTELRPAGEAKPQVGLQCLRCRQDRASFPWVTQGKVKGR